jgi:AcrR family transcriptional regulator
MEFAVMTVEYKGRGDPQRSLALLWRTQPEPTRGPKPSLTVDEIVAAAISIADQEGLAAVTMRRIAQQLRVGAMSLYTYVPGKAELLDVMLDTVFGEERTKQSADACWRERLAAHAYADWEMYYRHPWMLNVSDARSLLGPNEIALLEAALGTVTGLGLSGREMMATVSMVSNYVRGAARLAVEASRAADETGMTDEQWWQQREPLLDEVFDAERYPTIASVGLEGGFVPASGENSYTLQLAIEDFEFGLGRILDGIENYIARRG